MTETLKQRRDRCAGAPVLQVIHVGCAHRRISQIFKAADVPRQLKTLRKAIGRSDAFIEFERALHNHGPRGTTLQVVRGDQVLNWAVVPLSEFRAEQESAARTRALLDRPLSKI